MKSFQKMIEKAQELIFNGQNKLIEGNSLINEGQKLLDQTTDDIEAYFRDIEAYRHIESQKAQTQSDSSQTQIQQRSQKTYNQKQVAQPTNLQIPIGEIPSTSQPVEEGRAQAVLDKSTSPCPEAYLQEYQRVSALAYSIRTSATCQPIHEGMYPRMNFLPGAAPRIIKDLTNYGYVNSIVVSETDEEISLLPPVIQKGVKDFRHGVKLNGNVLLKFYSASPDWSGLEWYPAYHIVQIGLQKTKYPNIAQQWQDVAPEDINIQFIRHKRTLGLKVIYHTYERLIELKKAWTYGFTQNIAVMSNGNRPMNSISSLKLNTEKKKIMFNQIPSSLEVHKAFCLLMKHDQICAYCCPNDNPVDETTEDEFTII